MPRGIYFEILSNVIKELKNHSHIQAKIYSQFRYTVLFSEIMHKFLHSSQTNGSLCPRGNVGLFISYMEISHITTI